MNYLAVYYPLYEERVAVVVADQSVADAVINVAARADAGSASAMKIFSDINEAEAWLARPLDQIQ